MAMKFRNRQPDYTGQQVRADDRRRPTRATDLVGPDTAKALRIGVMLHHVLREVRTVDLDEAERARLLDLHRRAITGLQSAVTPELAAELDQLQLPSEDSRPPSQNELRVAEAQLVGWLEGAFRGFRMTYVAERAEAHAELESLRRSVPEEPEPSGAYI